MAVAFYVRAKTKPPGVKFFDTTHESAYEVQPSTISKINTAGQLVLITGTLFQAAWGVPGTWLLDPLTWAVGATTVWSGYGYLVASGLNFQRYIKR